MDDVLGCSPIPLSDVLAQIKGGNSTVYKCLGENRKLYAVKVLEGDDERRSIAFARQISAGAVLEESSILSPALIASNENESLLVYEWIEGFHPIASEKLAIEIIRVVQELKELFLLKPNFILAADALTHVAAEMTNIESRRVALQKLSDKESFETWSAGLIARLDWLDEINAINEFRIDTYSFSDFGVHNILSTSNDLFFLDTEFFGLDSSYKLLADLLLHPQNSFAPEVNLKLHKEISQLFNHDETKMRLVLQLLSLKWSTIAFKRFAAVNISGMSGDAYKLALRYLRVFDDFRDLDFREGIFKMHIQLRGE